MRLSTLSTALLLPAIGFAQAPSPQPPGWFLEGRLRQETVEDRAFAKDADALTLRLRGGHLAELGGNLRLLIEGEGTASLLDDFNSTRNGRTDRPMVADPDNLELNRAQIEWKPDERTRLTVGRQRLIYDNHRFVSANAWRQNEQTFDALDLEHERGALRLRYSYADRVQRIFGNRHPSRSLARWDLKAHLLHASVPLGPGRLALYAHFIENETLPLTSHRNLGLRYTGERKFAGGALDALQWSAEYARQDDHAGGSALIGADYLLLELALVRSGYRARLGYEVAGGDGRYAFQFPLGAGHPFFGWADRFVTVPPRGLVSPYLWIEGPIGLLPAGSRWTLGYHDFRPDQGGGRYGDEWNAQLAVPFSPKLAAIFKYADYRARGLATDTRKLWLALDFRL
ncbi:MAG: alginate export family protein [Xanthomonadales bacterium]|nr:alginate export family protein [Xanthomonadales bacterium]